jgi:phage shock protein A
MHRVPVGPLAREGEASVVELRREAVAAVARQQRLREQLAAVRPQAAGIEQKACRAFERGEELLARQILARGLWALQTRDALEEQLGAARRHVRARLAAVARAESGARRAGRRPETAVGTGGEEC